MDETRAIPGIFGYNWENDIRMPERCANSLRRDTGAVTPMSDHSIPTPTEDTTEDPIPYGYCRCGCGERTTIALRNRADRGWVKGDPVQYVAGHQGRIVGKMAPNPSGLCMCGCGRLTNIARETNLSDGVRSR